MSIALLEIFGKCPRKAARGPRKALRRVIKAKLFVLKACSPIGEDLTGHMVQSFFMGGRPCQAFVHLLYCIPEPVRSVARTFEFFVKKSFLNPCLGQNSCPRSGVADAALAPDNNLILGTMWTLGSNNFTCSPGLFKNLILTMEGRLNAAPGLLKRA